MNFDEHIKQIDAIVEDFKLNERKTGLSNWSSSPVNGRQFSTVTATTTPYTGEQTFYQNGLTIGKSTVNPFNNETKYTFI